MLVPMIATVEDGRDRSSAASTHELHQQLVHRKGSGLASCRTPGPVRAEIPAMPGAGTFARWRQPIPGVIGRADSFAVDGYSMQPAATDAVATTAWFEVDLDGIPGVTLPADEGTVVCIAAADHDEAGYRRLLFDLDQCARPVAEQCVAQADVADALREWSGYGGTLLVAWLTEQLEAGELKILWRRRYEFPGPAAEPAPSAPAPRRVAAPSTSAAPSPVYSTFPADFDAAAAARVLREAASSGVPFCEECMKARAAAGSPAEAV